MTEYKTAMNSAAKLTVEEIKVHYKRLSSPPLHFCPSLLLLFPPRLPFLRVLNFIKKSVSVTVYVSATTVAFFRMLLFLLVDAAYSIRIIKHGPQTKKLCRKQEWGILIWATV